MRHQPKAGSTYANRNIGPIRVRPVLGALLLLGLAWLVPVGARAEAVAGTKKDVATGLKIGYVDMARALNEVEEGRTAKAKLKGEFDLKQKRLDKMQVDFKAKKEDFDKRADMMKPDARQAKGQELQQDMMEVQRTYMQLQQELAETEKTVTEEINRKIRTVIEKQGDRDDYFLILNIGEAVLYNKRHMDVTDDVIREYNKLHAKPAAKK